MILKLVYMLYYRQYRVNILAYDAQLLGWYIFVVLIMPKSKNIEFEVPYSIHSVMEPLYRLRIRILWYFLVPKKPLSHCCTWVQLKLELSQYVTMNQLGKKQFKDNYIPGCLVHVSYLTHQHIKLEEGRRSALLKVYI